MKLDSMTKLYQDELADIHNAEQQLVKALPKMAAAASDAKLKTAFAQHLEQTRTHVKRLDEIFARMEKKPTVKVCKAMKGLIEESSEMIAKDGDPAVIDAGLIGAAQRVEHYEIAAYGCARTYASLLGDKQAEQSLAKTLDEEKAADAALSKLAVDIINVKAFNADLDEDADTDGDEPAKGVSRGAIRSPARMSASKSRA